MTTTRTGTLLRHETRLERREKRESSKSETRSDMDPTLDGGKS